MPGSHCYRIADRDCLTLQCVKIASIASGCGRSMNDTTFVWPPQSGQHKGATSYTRLMNIVQTWLRLVAEVFSLDDRIAICVTATPSDFLHMPRVLFE